MSSNQAVDYYEILQISPNAEPETVHRVFRLLAQRFHPDNAETGNEAQFRVLNDAYRVLSDPEQRARYDVIHTRLRQERWRLVASGAEAENNFDSERGIRLTVLEVLYTRRRLELDSPGLSPLDLEKLTGRAREHLEFTIWFLVQKKFVTRSDGSMLQITVDGVEYLENNYAANAQRRLGPGSVQKTPDSRRVLVRQASSIRPAFVDPRERNARVVVRASRRCLARGGRSCEADRVDEDRAAMLRVDLVLADLLRQPAVRGVRDDRRSVDGQAIAARVLEQPVQRNPVQAAVAVAAADVGVQAAKPDLEQAPVVRIGFRQAGQREHQSRFVERHRVIAAHRRWAACRGRGRR